MCVVQHFAQMTVQTKKNVLMSSSSSAIKTRMVLTSLELSYF